MKRNINKKCSLFPYVREEVLSLQDAMQKAGWSITAFDLPSAWKKTRGEGVKVGVLDTGCDLDHPDLKSNLLPGMNFVNPSSEPWDDNSHGTHVSGIIAAENNQIGMVGVAPGAKIVPVKVLDRQGNGSLDDVANGIRWAVDVGMVDLIEEGVGAAGGGLADGGIGPSSGGADDGEEPEEPRVGAKPAGDDVEGDEEERAGESARDADGHGEEDAEDHPTTVKGE